MSRGERGGVGQTPGIRWWPAAVIVVGALAVVAWGWAFHGRHRQDKVILTIQVGAAAAPLLLLWLVLLSRLRWKIRLGGLVLALAAAVAAVALLEVRGFTGDIVPVLGWRWGSQGRALTASRGPWIESVEDYPQFLGPNRNGRISGVGLAANWATSEPRLVWRRPVGSGWSGFAVASGLAVTQEQHGEQEVVSCYELASGEPRWRHADRVRFEDAVSGAGPRATPTIRDGRVYALGATGILNVLDLATGGAVWATDINADAGTQGPTYGVSHSPLVTDGLVIVAPGGSPGQSLVAYDRASGGRVWAGGDDPAAYSSPILAELAGVRQVLVFNGEALASHDLASGDVLWRYPWPSGSERVSQPAVLPGDRVFLSSGYGVGGKLFRVERSGDGSLAVKLLWESRGLKAKFTNVAYHDGFLYGLDDGILACLDPADGTRRWKGGRYGHGQLLVADDLLLIQAENGDVALVEATPERHRELGRIEALEGKTWNHPALAGRLLLVRNDRQAACWELPGA